MDDFSLNVCFTGMRGGWVGYMNRNGLDRREHLTGCVTGKLLRMKNERVIVL